MKKPIAVAIYLDSGDIHSKELFTEKQVQKVRDSEDEDTGEWKTILVIGSDLTVEYHT